MHSTRLGQHPTKRWHDAVRHKDGSIDWPWIRVRLFQAWAITGAVNALILFVTGNGGFPALISAPLGSVLVTTAGLAAVAPIGSVFFIRTVGRWW